MLRVRVWKLGVELTFEMKITDMCQFFVVVVKKRYHVKYATALCFAIVFQFLFHVTFFVVVFEFFLFCMLWLSGIVNCVRLISF